MGAWTVELHGRNAELGGPSGHADASAGAEPMDTFRKEMEEQCSWSWGHQEDFADGDGPTVEGKNGDGGQDCGQQA